MNSFIKGALLASTLLGTYAVAQEVDNPSTHIAEAASIWNSTKSKQLDQLMRDFSSQMNQSYAKGFYHTDWGYVGESNELSAPNNLGRLKISSSGSIPNVYNVVARYYRNDMVTSHGNGENYRYIFTIYNGHPAVYITGNTNGPSIEYKYSVSSFLQNGFANIVYSSAGNPNPKPKPKASKTYKYNEMLTAKSSNYKLFGNKTFSNVKGYSKSGRVYQARGYFNYKGKRYYSLYQKNGSGKYVWRGYMQGSGLTKVNKYASKNKYVMAKSNYSRFDNLYFSKKKGSTGSYRGKFVTTKYGYKLGNGKTYYSTYYKNKFIGYVEKRALTYVQKEYKVNYTTTLKGNRYSRWSNLSFNKKQGYAKKGDVFKVKRCYQVKGKRYYSTYKQNRHGKDVWTGYIDGNGLRKLTRYQSNNQWIVKKSNYGRYSNLYFSHKKGSTASYRGKQVKTKYGYKLGNGKTYYSTYYKNKFIGYIEKGALTHFSSRAMDSTMTMTGNKYTLWGNLAFSSKKGYAKKGQVYQARRVYTLSGGRKYYSVYTRSSKAEWVWRGYIAANGLKRLPSSETNFKAVVKDSSAGRWNNLYFTNRRGTVSDYKHRNVEVRRIFTLGDGKKYYSVYTPNGTWLGYMHSSTVDTWKKTGC